MRRPPAVQLQQNQGSKTRTGPKLLDLHARVICFKRSRKGHALAGAHKQSYGVLTRTLHWQVLAATRTSIS